MKLKEENLIRHTDLALEKNQKHEEASLKSELEKKHLGEQVELRKLLARDHAKLRNKLDLQEKEDDTEQLALDKYRKSKEQE